ncbi:MAG TPA: peptidase U32 [Ruminococcaceae bacterium]|nr:peptidase U32 [Oscillospiraceae bacterium]
MESLRAAVLFGADAVYLAGKTYGMRQGAANFSGEELSEAVSFAHAAGIKVYLTCNTLPHSNEIDRLPEFVKTAANTGVDAFILSDLGVLEVVKKHAPKVDIHASVQSGIVNYAAARMLHSMGASRVILARELTLEEIAYIRVKTPPELTLETFVHGAVCVSHSARCLLSDYLTGRDANRGECAQPCRWKYRLVEETRPGLYFPVNEDADGCYIMNANDLNMIRHIPELAAAGIGSFKIEGRAKSAYYTAVTAASYRRAIDHFSGVYENRTLPKWVCQELDKISHRPYSTGFYFGRPHGQQTPETGGYIRKYQVAAVAEGYEEGALLVTQRNRFFPGSELDVLAPGMEPEIITAGKLFDETGAELETANRPMQKIRIQGAKPFPPGSLLRIKVYN